MSDKRVRVRFAPSPTGPLHMGGVRTALYNYLFAKKNGGDFILRIEDTDSTRFVPGAEDYIVDAMKWCGFEPDESQQKGGNFGPYVQSQRKDIYAPFAEKLIESGNAYYAFDTAEELDYARDQAKKAGIPSWQYNHITRGSMKNSISLSEDEVKTRMDNGEPYVIRAKMPRNEEVRFHDIVRGWVVVNTNNLDDKVLYKSDGMPTYHMANIIDDHHMEISHVIRGEEWLPSAPLHVLLYRFLGWDCPEFAHLPLLLKPDGNGKLSKRDGDRLGFPVFPTQWNVPGSDEVFSGYREDGYFPGAFVNMLALLGWNPGTPQEIFSMDELIEAFSLERVGKSGAKYDPDKTKWFNQQYLRAKSGEELAELLSPILEQNNINSDSAFTAKVCELMKERATFIQDIWKEGAYFFTNPSDFDEKTARKKWKEDTAKHIEGIRAEMEQLSDWNAQNIETTFKAFLEKNELGIGKVMPNLRLVISGKGMGPSLFEMMELLGKEECLSRIEKNAKAVQAMKAEA